MSRKLRILDLGSHDGYLSLWLARQLRERDVEVRVDGLELAPGAVEVARRRFADEAIEASFVCGDARQVDEYFDAGTYDAVVVYELLEHVPDPGALLAVAESMLTHGGRVYVSTPDGCFGEGSNPHHLRAWRSIDLADLLRRRGRLDDMAVGPDGVCVAAYSPCERKGDVAIFTGGGWETWSPHDVERKGLGGSETAAIRLAEQLSELGYVVTVYGEVEQGVFRDVIFRHHSVFDPMDRRDVLICSRVPELADRHMNARVRMLWLHDTDCGDRLTPARAEPFDHVLTLSRWHADHVAGTYPFVRDKVRRIRNGIELAYFAGEQPERRRRVVYTSSPDRGLDKLLEWWPQIRERVPDAELACCYSAVYDRVAESDPEIAAHRERIQNLVQGCEGVERLGSLSQPEVARLMRSSMVWAAPSWTTPRVNAPFHETSCIGAMEAQAAGCLVIASDWGALSETVEVGRLVGREKWETAFVDEIVDALTNEDAQRWAQAQGPKAAAKLGWDGVALMVAGLIDGEAVAFEPKAIEAATR